MRRTFQYRATMNTKTEKVCVEWLELCRILYNLALEQRIMIYRQRRKGLTYFSQTYYLPELKKEFPQFGKVNANVLMNVLKRVDLAYQGFFRRGGFPRFKGKDRYDSFTLRDGYKLDGRYLHVSRIGRLKIHLSRPIEGTIKTVTVRRDSVGKWFVSFSCDGVEARTFPQTTETVGIDVGIKSFCVDSDGLVIANPMHLKKSLAVLRRKQRTLARRVRGSTRRQAARVQVAMVCEKVANQRKDFLHKTANHYIQHYNEIAVEDLNIKGMVRNRHLARSISDSSWGMFFTMLSYKAEGAGRVVTKVNPKGTSQRCSSCGEKVPKTLAERIHCCPHCGIVLDRDYNAALNIHALGQSVHAPTKADVGLCVA